MTTPRFQTQIGIRRITAEGGETIRTVSEDVQIVERSMDGLCSLSELASVHAERCIYCASSDQLSSEHVVPYAWGGTVQIHSGSCENCRLVTSQFENFALNDGAMAHVRKALELPSRSKHSSVRRPLAMSLTGKGRHTLALAEDVITPVILGFPLFVRPGALSGDGTRLALHLEGIAAAAFGADIASFLTGHSAAGATQREDSKRVMAFARAIAKIAYGWAWRDGVAQKLAGTESLVNAFMNCPEQLGAHVGTKPPPYERYVGCQLRIEYKLAMPSQLVYLEVQLFADTGAPTYEVVLGRVDSMRAWRQLRQSFCR